jgi:hypothetical protein
MAIWNSLQSFGIFYDHLEQFVFIWYIFSGIGIMRQEKSGNPEYFEKCIEKCYNNIHLVLK